MHRYNWSDPDFIRITRNSEGSSAVDHFVFADKTCGITTYIVLKDFLLLRVIRGISASHVGGVGPCKNSECRVVALTNAQKQNRFRHGAEYRISAAWRGGEYSVPRAELLAAAPDFYYVTDHYVG
jgi:hypothetical protein